MVQSVYLKQSIQLWSVNSDTATYVIMLESLKEWCIIIASVLWSTVLVVFWMSPWPRLQNYSVLPECWLRKDMWENLDQGITRSSQVKDQQPIKNCGEESLFKFSHSWDLTWCWGLLPTPMQHGWPMTRKKSKSQNTHSQKVPPFLQQSRAMVEQRKGVYIILVEPPAWEKTGSP